MQLVSNNLDLVVLLGVEEVYVPPDISWDACVMLTWVLSKFLSSNRVGHRLLAWPCFPHREHGGVTYTVGVLVMMGNFDVC